MDDKKTSPAEYSKEWWDEEIKLAEKRMEEGWWKAGDNIVRRFLDKRTDDMSDLNIDGDSARKYNMFWANTELIKSALYATPPRPEAKRENDDPNDDVGRTAALILERMLQFDFKPDNSNTHDSLDSAVQDYLIPGLGQAWVRLETDTEEREVPPVVDPMTGQELAPGYPEVVVTDQRAIVDYVHWRDFVYPAIRRWQEVPWVARRLWMSRKQFEKKWPKDQFDAIKDEARQKSEEGNEPKGFRKGKAEVFEIHCKDSNKVYWYNRHLPELLESKDDFLKLEGFFPCPKPLISTHTTSDFSPRADYTMLRDQYEELDILNQRISILTKALRVVGVYDKTNAELSAMLTGSEFRMIPVDNWAAFAEKGGIKGSIDWFPVKDIADVLASLMEQRVAVMQQIYELTSLSDIVRGTSNPRETLGAQKMKAQFSSVRLQLKQQDVGKFVREVLALRAEIICKHFTPEQIIVQSQVEETDSAMFAQPAVQLLKDYNMFRYRIEVGEETLSLADYNAERALRTEYLTAVGQFISQAGQILQTAPQAAPYLLKMIAWTTASFRGAKDIESVLDQAIKAATAAPPGGPGQGPDPMKQAEADVVSNKSRAEADAASAQAKSQAKIAEIHAKSGADAQSKVMQVLAANAMPEPSQPQGEQ